MHFRSTSIRQSKAQSIRCSYIKIQNCNRLNKECIELLQKVVLTPQTFLATRSAKGEVNKNSSETEARADLSN